MYINGQKPQIYIAIYYRFFKRSIEANQYTLIEQSVNQEFIMTEHEIL